MHDVRQLLTDESVVGLKRRGYEVDTAGLGELAERRRELIRSRDELRTSLKRSSGSREEARAGRGVLQELEAEIRSVETGLHDRLLRVPNVPAEEAPDGTAAEEPVVVRSWDPPGRTWLGRKDHAELGEELGILDPGRAAKLSGARFAVTRGAGARLERALVSFLLDRHAGAGYVEHGLPHLVTPEVMTGTGQLPKFAEDLFHTAVADRELLLIPTAEVPLVNLYRGESLDPAALPIAVTARTPCYRAEAGSYGRDTRGLIRVHQFEKVELVRLCRPQDAGAELERLTAHAAGCLEELGLAYRVIDLRAGDLGFTARRTFDLEVWLPGQDAYREISSCSDCGDFQARRAGIRLRGGGFPHTLNGSALPIGRTLAAILEQYQRPDGSVEVPAALVPYCGLNEMFARGSNL
ncbi:serine--tRNA ligase [Dactylosporangium sp. NPDC049140]|uniref:serine--tRNA ligase n=1 Tax=Dactylosporangium sp. NPDC049140 TaxID=3155647 RepID=UPI0033F231FF